MRCVTCCIVTDIVIGITNGIGIGILTVISTAIGIVTVIGIVFCQDDDGLQNQRWAPFEERVSAVAKAVAKANAETGKKCLYAPCLNSPAHLLLERAMFAKRAGAGAVLMLPGITGFDSVRMLASNSDFGLPILCHPAYLGMVGGSNTPGTPIHGFAHRVQQALIPRMAGCDVTIFLNTGSRFSMTQEECLSISEACTVSFGECKPMFPCPAGGMALDSTQHQVAVYGKDVALLIGGSLLTESTDLVANAKKFAQLAGRA
jgi:ribulose-bisphosphate carboxylase large chain